MAHKTYIGDGVYVEMDQEQDRLVLTTEDGISIQNTIYLEPKVWDALRDYVARFEKHPEVDVGTALLQSIPLCSECGFKHYPPPEGSCADS